MATALLPVFHATARDGVSAEATAKASVAAVNADEPSATPPPQDRFDVWEFRVLGNTVLPQRDVERAVYSYLGEGRTIADVESARAALETAYRDAGYGTVFVDIPEQSTGDGVVRLNVTEGRLDRLRVTGARYYSNRRLLAALPSLRQGEVPQLPVVQADLAAVNARSRDRRVVPILKAGRAPGTVDVELKVSDSLPVTFSTELNDRYSSGTSELRANFAVSYDNLFQRDESFGLQYQLAPQDPKDLKALVASYVFRLDALPETTLFLYAVRSDTDVAALGTLSVLGNGRIFGARAIRALPSTQSFSHSLTLGLDYKDFTENVRFAEDEALQTPIRYVNWTFGYGGAARSERATWLFDVAANMGLRGLVNDTREFADKRYLGKPSYFYLRGSVERTGAVDGPVQLHTRVGAQASAQPLITNEQLALGGVDTVRGYLESNVVGDYGASATLELRSMWPFSKLGGREGASYALVFADAGTVALLDPLPGQASRTHLASWGAGLRVGGLHGFDLAVDWARALRDAGTVRAGDDRAHFSVKYGF